MYKVIFFSLFVLLSGQAFAAKSVLDLPMVPMLERQQAPDFVTQSLRDGQAGLADYEGKVVMLHFFATWCHPCQEEMVGMEKLWQRYMDKDFAVVVISHGTDSKEDVKTFVSELNLSFPVLLDPEGQVNETYSVSRVPTTFLIDKSGKVVSRVAGMMEWHSTEGNQLVESLLNESMSVAGF